MKNVHYIEIFKKAALLTWKNRVLWWLGFFVLLGSLGINFPSSNNSDVKNSELTNWIIAFSQNHPAITLTLAILLFVLFFFLFLLRIVAKTGIIKSVANMELYAKQPLRILLKASLPYLKSLFMLEISISFGIFILLLILAIPITYLFYLEAYAFGSMVILGALAIFIPTIVLAYFILRFSYIYRVLGNSKLLPSIEAAYFLFKENFKESLLMAFLSLAAGIIFAFFFLLGVALVAFAAVMISIIPYFIFGKIAPLIVAALCLPLFLLLVLLALSFWKAFTQTVWVIFFQEIAAKKITEEIIEAVVDEEKILNAHATN